MVTAKRHQRAKEAAMLLSAHDIQDIVFNSNGTVSFIKDGYQCVYMFKHFEELLGIGTMNYRKVKVEVEEVESKSATSSLYAPAKVLRFK